MSNGEKKGLSPVAWMAIGCGGCLVVVLLAMGACGGLAWFRFGDAIGEFKDNPAKATAMMIIEANPDLELVSSDDTDGTITIRNLKKNETITLDYDEISEGRFRLETDQGEMRIDASGDAGTMTFSGKDGDTKTVLGAGAEIVDWLPDYPGAENLQSMFSSNDGSGSSGAYTFHTDDGLQEVIDWFSSELGEDDWAETSRMSQAGQLMNVTFEKDQRTVTVIATPAKNGDGSQVTLQYQEKQ